MSLLGDLEGAWVAVQVRIQCERIVAAELERRGYEQFLPLYRPKDPARPTSPSVPLFPGYVFCRYTRRNPFRIVDINPVVRILSVDNVPLPVPDAEIDAIRRALTLGVHTEPWRFMKSGQCVRICRGPLSGIEGILLTIKSGVRVIVTISLLRRSVAVEVDPSCLVPVPRSHPLIRDNEAGPQHATAKYERPGL
jgi:transcription termination/antitermination protein NusG